MKFQKEIRKKSYTTFMPATLYSNLYIITSTDTAYFSLCTWRIKESHPEDTQAALE